MNTDKIIEEFIKTRKDRDELKILKQRPAMLGDLIEFATQFHGSQNLKSALPEVRKMSPVCLECGEPMINSIDSTTKKVSKYLWETNCKHAKNLRLSIG